MTTSARLVFALVLSVCGCGLAGCSAPKDGEALRAFLNEPRRMVSPTEYRVMPPDMLKITSHNISELNDANNVLGQKVRPDGKINLPLLGEIMAANKTPKEIEEEIKEAARKYYQEVDATVQVISYDSQWIYVFGQVSHPGPMPYNGTNTLLDTLARAIPNDLAWKEHITLVRGSHPQFGGCAIDKNGNRIETTSATEVKTGPAGVKVVVAKTAQPVAEDSQPHKLVFNLMDMVQKGDLDENVLLLPNDVIYVEPTTLAKIGLAMQQLLLPISPAAQAVGAPGAAATPYSSLK